MPWDCYITDMWWQPSGDIHTQISGDRVYPYVIWKAITKDLPLSLAVLWSGDHAENSALILKVCMRRKSFSSQPWKHFGRSVLNLLKAVNPFGRSGFHLCFIWIPAHHLWLTNKSEIAFGRAGALVIQRAWPELLQLCRCIAWCIHGHTGITCLEHRSLFW